MSSEFFAMPRMTRRVNILMIATLYAPYRLGGAEVVFCTVVNELKKEHDVSILTTAPWSGFRSLLPTRSKEDGVTVYRFYPFNFCWFISFLKKPMFLRLIWHLLDACNLHSYGIVRSVIGAVRPDVVITHNIKGIGYTIPRAVAHSGVPHIHTVHDIQLIYPSGILTVHQEQSFPHHAVWRVWSVVTRWLFGSPTTVVFASRFLLDFYARRHFFPRSQQKVLPNPYRMTNLQISYAQQIFSVVTFAFIGQLEEHKGILLLLQAWSAWKWDDVRLVVAGSGSLEPRVRTAASRDSRIAFVGYADDSGLFLGDVMYVVVPSVCYENVPMVIVESFTHGVPVIGARIGGIPEYVEEGVNGFLFSPGDLQSLVEALERAYTAREQHARFSRNTRASLQGSTCERYCAVLLSSVGL